MSLLIIGSDGFIGRHFVKTFPDAYAINRQTLDLLNPDINKLPHADFAVICAGIGNPKLCESDPQKSYECNVIGTLKLCKSLIFNGIKPVVFSSDYVFDGQLLEYTEISSTSPLNSYGRQKAELEEQALNLDCLIVRLSKVYGTQKGDKSLIDEMALNFFQKKEVRAASDQIFAPLHVDDVVRSVMALLMKKCRGLYNLAGDEKMSRHQLAKKIAEKMGKKEFLKEISLDDLSETFRRPKNTVLVCKKLKKELETAFMTLDQSIDIIARNYGIN